MAMYSSDRPTGIPCALCPMDATCPHWCERGLEWVHINLPIVQAAILTRTAPELVPVDPKTCRWCGKPISTRGQYCSDECKLQAKRKQNREFMRGQRNV